MKDTFHFFGTVKEPNFLAVGITFFIGLIITAYRVHLWNKITHIMWTRQALREYGVPSIFVKKAKSQITLGKNNILSDKESTLADKESLENYLEMLDRRLIEGKISETTYNELKRKFEVRLKRIEEDKASLHNQPFFIPVDRGIIRNKNGSMLNT
jgi:hypothetical protein